MPQSVRNFFVKLTRSFRQHSGSSHSIPSSSNDDILPDGLAPTLRPQIYTLSPSHPPIPSNKPLPPIPPPAVLPQTPALPVSQLPTLPPQMVSSHLTASSLNHPFQLPSSTLRPPSPDLILSSSLLPASHAPTPQPRELVGFAGAHDFIIKDSKFMDISLGRPGLKGLLKHSMPDAFHNSAARYPPPKCHLGTRNDYITKITEWALGDSGGYEPILWMRGPFGIGKSAVAQSCAEVLQTQDKLAATLFFSRSNANRDDPQRVFTSIAYQVATVCHPFRDIVDERVRDDPAITTKSISTQFKELLIRPLSQIDNPKNEIEGRVVVIDGLDECRGSSEQCEIINVIAASARDRSNPFRWFITSRPEDAIIRTMKSPAVASVSVHLELPVSREIDHEILLYLTDEFKKIRSNHSLADSWPPEGVLALLVERAAGLWIYITTIVRFITDENSLGPESQLQIVLAFLKDVSAEVGPDNPLTEMDFFYTLILQRIPPKIRTIVRKILLLSSANLVPEGIASVLGISVKQFRHTCASIQSVAELQGSDFESTRFHFYHASFLDFMKDSERSKELCIHGNFLIEYRRERLDWLHGVCSLSTGPSHIAYPFEPVLLEGWDRTRYYSAHLYCFWELCCVPNHPIDFGTAQSLGLLKPRMMLRLMGDYGSPIDSRNLQCFRDNLPIEHRDRILREGKCPRCIKTKKVWILGHGENEAVAERYGDGGLKLTNNQDSQFGRCPCGS